MIELNQESCRDLNFALTREWLETNGIGGSGVIHPQGFNYQTGFRLDPFPTFTYEIEGMRILGSGQYRER